MRTRFVAVSLALCFTVVATPANAWLPTVTWAQPVVVDTVTKISDSTWQYNFTVTNMAWWRTDHPQSSQFSDDARLTDYLLPYFSDAGISTITAPTGWISSIDAEDRFDLGHGAQALHWHATSVSNGIAGAHSPDFDPYAIGDTLGGFSFVASFSPVKAPFMSIFGNGFSEMGDPALPGSPNALASGLTRSLPFSAAPIPEAETYAMMLAGLGLLGLMARRRQQKATA